jgi:pSer/pThr/pTyr-binding forkhead associated (FHA) protein
MSQLELGGNTFTIPVGEVVLGSDAGCAISLSGAGVLPRHAVLQGQADGQVIIRKASPAADVLINGVRLGAEPTPLLHGDKVEVGDHELTFVDERRSGSTQYVRALSLPQGAGAPAAPGAPGGPGGGPQARPGAKAIGTSGGRVVSLTDGREYVITGASLVFGREAGCDVVVPGKDVSRRHAEIVHTPQGYLVVDSSTNGTFVNEEQVQGQRLLARTDVIRIGEEQFRFYAEAPPLTASSASPAGPAAGSEQLKHTLHGIGAAAPPLTRPTGPAFAAFLVRSGGLMGQRIPVKTPIVNLGRADYNDIVLPDPSISTSHAKLQRREGVWVLVDLDSTNGTFVEGERVRGEAPLGPGAMVRLGDVQLLFEPAEEQQGVLKGGGTQVLRTPHSSAPPAPPAAAAPLSPPAPPVSPARPTPPPPAAAPAAAPRPAAPAKPAGPARPGTKPAPRRPVGQQPPPKKGKGCGSSAAVLAMGGAAMVALLYRLLA